MVERAAVDAGFASWRDDWLDARPEWRLVAVFHPIAQEPAVIALELLAREWIDAALAIREPEVARRKLAWWLDELGEQARGRARHPLTMAIAKDPRAAGAVAPLARAVGAALALVGTESVGSVEDLTAAIEPVARGLDEAGVALGAWRLAGAERSPAMAAALVVEALREWPRFARPERGLVPLRLLARHGIDRAAAHAGTEPRATDAVLRDLALELRQRVGADRVGGLAGARLAIARVWLEAIARDPRAAREGRLAAPRFRLLWSLWRAARAEVGR